MKVRAQRTHFTGESNRQIQFLIRKKSDIFQKSHARSNSSYLTTTENKEYQVKKKSNQKIKQDIFSSTHCQFERLKLNKPQKKVFMKKKSESMNILPLQNVVQTKLNEKILNIKTQLNENEINMHKLSELKHIFIKNNSKRKNLIDYYNKFATQNNGVTIQGLQKLVQQYGYHINSSQAKALIKLNQIHSKEVKSQKQTCLKLPQFINLMTKQNIYFQTLKFKNQNQSKPILHYEFSPSQFQIFRNKFHKLKQALNVYKGEKIYKQIFDNVMKKLDINDLIITQKQREKIFQTFSAEGILNAQKLIGNIALQQLQRVKNSGNINLDSSFIDHIKSNKQYKFQNKKHFRQFNFSKASFLEFQKNLQAANSIISELRSLKNKKNDLLRDLCKNKGFTTKSQLRETVQTILQQNGFNFAQQEYSSFVNFINYDHSNNVSLQQLNKLIFYDQKKQILDRLDRRKRKLQPQNCLQQNKLQDHEYDFQLAIQTINKIKQQKMNPQNSKIFNDFDKDRDGYLTQQQLKNHLQQLNFNQHQANNFVKYLRIKDKSYLDFADFNQKFSPKILTQDNFNAKLRSKSSFDWNHKKKSFINEQNKINFMVPTKFSAWPKRLYQTDFSLIQCPRNSGIHIQQHDRFNVIQKNSLGLSNKQQRIKLYENKLKRIAKWNNIVQQRAEQKEIQFQKKNISKSYNLRLIKQNYEAACHGKITQY